MKTIQNLWNKTVNWFEHGDLVPLLVLVSAVHYAIILKDKDHFAVAIAIGTLVDLGHYRTVRAAVRYQYSGKKNRQKILRWFIVLGMTVISLVYHQRYYNDWWLSVPIPLLIAVLAWLYKADENIGKTKPKAQQKDSKIKAKPSEPKATRSKPKPKTFIAECPRPDCSWSHNGYKSKRAAQNALNGHMLKHKKDREHETRTKSGSKVPG